MLVPSLRAQNERLREIIAALSDALEQAEPYVEGAYECAFPNPSINEGVLHLVRLGQEMGKEVESFPVL